ncbi:hypothetical protein LIER_19595 [Lithospermum erythrorhizon]|uniref:Chromo domain-containing protein n=1 Tax=Lithospermum erythrorhizon TaxID=34254 RepID=A0AAV3QI91_LITER
MILRYKWRIVIGEDEELKQRLIRALHDSAIGGHSQLSEASRIHPVFHVSLLKKHIERTVEIHKNFPETLPDGSFPIYPIAILNKRTILRDKIYVYQVLIRWNHSSPKEATWEDYHFIWKKFPQFLGVKEAVREGECQVNVKQKK